MAERLRILLLIDSLTDLGGAERLVGHIAQGLDRNRFEPTLCATRAVEEGAAASAAAAGIRVIALHRTRTLSPRAWLRLWRELRRGVDVLHTHKFGSNVWGSLLGRLARVPVVIAHEHTWSYEGAPLRKLLDRRLIAPLVDAFVAVSREDARRMAALERIDPELIEVIPNGIPAPSGAGGADVRAELGIAADAPLVGAVCVLRPQKALDVLVEAVALLRQQRADLRAVVVGEGPQRAALEALAQERGVGDAIVFAGRRQDIPEVLAALDVVVSSSDYEGSPLALIEAMAAGKPIVATRVGGVPDLIDDGVHGVLVEPRNPAALAAAVATLLADPQAREGLGARARRRQEREFTVAATIARLEELYERLFAEKRAQRSPRSEAPTALQETR